MKLPLWIVAALCIVTAGADALANDVREFSLEKKVGRANVVVIGHVVATRDERVAGMTLQYAQVRVDTVLKGSPPNVLDVLAKGSIAEFDPDCCDIGKVYLFLLSKAKGGKFESVNGRFGIYPIPTPR